MTLLSCLKYFNNFQELKMISDEDILLHLDEIIANEESEDEFIDDINFYIENDDIEVIELVVSDPLSSYHSPIDLRTIAPVRREKKYHYRHQILNGKLKETLGQKNIILTHPSVEFKNTNLV
ncbi:uncharacterized protein LOC112601700 isoform X1 [Melanaphis sacchari]|uniref:uncharacterized protein LOC112601700 isoform X1 n=1 Tax=Melanaphis sacchari TaxID=742174 RepID=UPI000DC13E65|nr:uncharacterized protein LOC112601700 isoform X1 [Melanaphis sacchari]